MKIFDTRIQNGLPEGNDFILREFNFPGRSQKPFKIDGGAIILCSRGEAEIAIDGKHHKVSERCEAILLDGSTLFIKRCSDDICLSAFIYSKEIAYQAMYKFDPSFFNVIMSEPVFRNSEESLLSIKSYMQIISHLQNDVHNGYSHLIVANLLRCIMLNIYDKLKRKGELESSMTYTRKEEVYSNFMSLVTENARKHRDVAFYADRLCISSRYLGGVTREVSGKTPKHLIDEFLLSEIKLMLTFSEMSIQQIADYLHFPDQSYFGRFFRRFTGMSPQSYRKKEMTM